MRFMVTMHFAPQGPDEMQKIGALVPAEQAHVRELTERGIVEVMYLAADFATVWLVMQAASTEEVQQELTKFPLYPYMQAEVMPLGQPARSA